MIVQMNQIDVITILKEQFDFELNLKEGFYYRKDNQEMTVFMWSPSYIDLDNHPGLSEYLASVGLPLFSKKKGQLHLYPTFIDCLLEDYPDYVLDTKLLTLVSFGEFIPLNNPDGMCYLSDNLGSKVALGRIENQVFLPLVDLGWYLRVGS